TSVARSCIESFWGHVSWLLPVQPFFYRFDIEIQCPLRRIWIGDCKLLPRGESTVVVLGLFGGEILEVGEISIDCGSGRVVYFLHFPEKGIDDTGLVGVKSEFTDSLGQCPCVLLWQSAAKGFGAPS